jgi:hypothetical protein
LRQDALQLWHACRDGTASDFVTAAKALHGEITYQLHDRLLHNRDHCGGVIGVPIFLALKFPDDFS